MNGSKFGQRKNTGYPVFLWLVLLPADIIVYISLSDLLLFMDFIKRKTIKKYKKISFLGRVWGEGIFQSKQKTASLSLRSSVLLIQFFFLFYLVVIKPSGSTVNEALSAMRPSGRSRYQPSLYLMKVSDFMSPLTESQ